MVKLAGCPGHHRWPVVTSGGQQGMEYFSKAQWGNLWRYESRGAGKLYRRDKQLSTPGSCRSFERDFINAHLFAGVGTVLA
jgi:hypothetical protein